MAKNYLSRRRLLAIASATLTAGKIATAEDAAKPASARTAPFTFCFNTSTIRGQKLTLDQEVEITAKAGYNAIEPWVDKISQYVENGGSLKDMHKRIADSGLTVESAIAFFQWIVDDETERAKGLEQAKRYMDLLAQIGGKRIASPPAGATKEAGLDLFKAAERYRVLLELGDSFAVVPQIELWGASKNLCRLGEAMFVVIESGHPKGCLLPDVYHIYKGGSDFNGLKLLSARAIQVFHLNDYPADPPRQTITDRDRVYPGDGIAPLTQILRDLQANGSRAVLSLELFNPTYWRQDPLEVAKTGLLKMKAAVNKALGAYRVANSQPGRSADANDTSAPSVTTSRPDVEQVMAEYEYVASKNSEVFHKPDCRWAKEISPQNLVGYDTREQVIEAGKKPCRWCKP